MCVLVMCYVFCCVVCVWTFVAMGRGFCCVLPGYQVTRLPGLQHLVVSDFVCSNCDSHARCCA